MTAGQRTRAEIEREITHQKNKLRTYYDKWHPEIRANIERLETELAALPAKQIAPQDVPAASKAGENDRSTPS